MTTGCKECNRPYYNERPGQIPYNYPYKPTEEEIQKAIEEALTDKTTEGG
jgi:biotin synthase